MENIQHKDITLPHYSLLIPVSKRKISETSEIIQIYLIEKYKFKKYKKILKRFKTTVNERGKQKNHIYKEMKSFINNNNVTRDRLIEIFHIGETQEELDIKYSDIMEFLENEVIINENNYLKIKNI